VATGDRADHRQFGVDRLGIGPGCRNHQVGGGCRKRWPLVPLPMMKSTEASIERRLGGPLPSNGDLMLGAAREACFPAFLRKMFAPSARVAIGTSADAGPRTRPILDSVGRESHRGYWSFR
jgi:hypothetical protein